MNVCKAIEINQTNRYAEVVVIKQLSRSATSICFNYGEARSAESTKDFIHKTRIALKELNETRIGLRMLSELRGRQEESITSLLNEAGELIGIFVASIRTAEKKL